MSVAAKGGHSGRDWKLKFFSGHSGDLFVEEFYTRQRASHPRKREEWIQQVRRERLQGTAEARSSAPRLASSSAAPLLRKNECPGTHCSKGGERRQFLPDLKKSFEVKEKIGKRTEGESERRSGRFVGVTVLPRPAKSLQIGRRVPPKNNNKWVCRKEWPQRHKVLSSWQGHQSHLCQKEKEQNYHSRLPDRDMRESQGERGPPLGEKEKG